ncbi:tRNA (adenosine(37)-N6)-dimethylallyltransferase MiaA [Pannonibacter tanglangensis]|uniref:tRNA dimethylallyltransferase n=1 Tax=Pannonibacter tanglangensis TaxID=2750084 RepID=A0ABW9ZL12_9HYPH|nr:tRNA (adenosine(37)-N6)-dimethylallyltransferase MiaA [Pannonibacter sp. XCT-34]NBN63405.1 tRNA (adenosine(37)-N6)-dimethylallyltransferase MiaA [Pannonibacter sp. XCT-34]
MSNADATGAILIAGPTASGKSALAVALAERLGGLVINADSMQLYRELRLVSARPGPEDEARAPHRLYGVLPAAEAFSTGAWLGLVAAALDAARASGLRPILVGGTGLYFRALTEGFAEVPAIPADIRTRCRSLAEDQGLEAVRSALAPLDPDAAGRLQDLQRLTRALEVVLATGRTLAAWQAERPGAPLLPQDRVRTVVLAPPRAWLHARIARRAGLMLSEEGIAEVRDLLALGLPATLPAMRAIGVKEIGGLLAGAIDRAEVERQLVVATRQYAKRQETFFRGQLAAWPRLDPSGVSENALLDQVLAGPRG